MDIELMKNNSGKQRNANEALVAEAPGDVQLVNYVGKTSIKICFPFRKDN